MATTAVPTLTSEGWITAPDKKCDRLLMNAFASDASQSNIYAGAVCSIQNTIYLNNGDPVACGNAIASALTSLYERYFAAATFKCTVTEFDDQSGRYDIGVEGTVVQDNRKYDFGRMVESANGIVVKIMTASGDVMWASETIAL